MYIICIGDTLTTEKPAEWQIILPFLRVTKIVSLQSGKAFRLAKFRHNYFGWLKRFVYLEPNSLHGHHLEQKILQFLHSLFDALHTHIKQLGIRSS